MYMDHCCCFGCTSSSGIFGRCADAIKAIYLYHPIDLILKWADDFSFWRYPVSNSTSGPWVYRCDESLIWDIANSLGWPWSMGKSSPFASSFKYLGFEWNLTERTVSLAADKKAKFLRKLDGWTSGAKVSRRSCSSVIGSLSHCSVVIKYSRSHLTSLYRLSSRFLKLENEFVVLPIPSNVLSDIEWWRRELSADQCGCHIVKHPPASPILIYVDASSTWGIGFVMNNRWLAWPLKSGWENDNRKIGWAEFVALELAMLCLVSSVAKGATFTIHSDNKGVIGTFNSSYSRNPEQNIVLRRILCTLYDNDMWLDLKWIASEENPADGPSRGMLPLNGAAFGSPPRLPYYLKPYIGNAILSNNKQ
jgi:hypothetical protein